ncbi:MAG TPA: sulfite exporter TauE/SafE family protein [Candidatus Rubrimentiphilum sp.]|nr:sulfite exporter TauE/SafE family protein [Candidatus Rubrimentiphilum sp.]
MLWLFIAGLLASILGSMVGLGGGFIIVPVLRIFYGLSPPLAAGTSLALVIANSASASTSYLLQRRVHLRTGWLIAAGGIPGGILGAIAVKHASPRVFDWLFAAFLLAVSADIVINRERRLAHRTAGGQDNATGTLFTGFAVGFVSSLFGVGGGVILIPSLLYFSTLPAHVIAATSQFAILLTSPVGFLTQLLQHDVAWNYVIPLVLGGILGGPIGARLSLRLKSPVLMLCVAGALTVAAFALVFRDIFG